MNDTWAVLTQYKFLEEKIEELREEAAAFFPPSQDIEESLQEAELELEKLKMWINTNFPTHKAD